MSFAHRFSPVANAESDGAGDFGLDGSKSLGNAVSAGSLVCCVILGGPPVGRTAGGTVARTFTSSSQALPSASAQPNWSVWGR